MRALRGWWLGLVLCACGGDTPQTGDATGPASDAPAPDPNDGARSGTRLKLSWYQFTDGTRQWSRFYDAERKESCSIYAAWTDGHQYCVPDQNGSVVYTDAACSRKVEQIYVDPSCAQPPGNYALELNETPCVYQPAHLYLRGAATTVANYYFRFSDGTCGGPYASGTSYDYYQLGAEVPPSALVEITTTTPASSGRLGQPFYQSGDGMQLPVPELYDSQLAAMCYPSTSLIDPTAASCAPDSWYAGNFHDATCSQPELDVPAGCAAPQYAETFPSTSCAADRASYFAVGAKVGGAPLYYGDPSSCTSTTPTAGDGYYLLGAHVSLATMTRTPDTAPSHRVQLIHYTTADGLRSRASTLYDAQQGAECYPTTLPDGTIRCVVFGDYIQTFYRDAMCKTPIDLVEQYVGPSGCAAPPVQAFARKSVTPPPGSCAYGTEVHAITTAYTAAVYSNYGTCAVYQPTTTKLFNVGPAIDLTQFVSASISIDP